MVAIPLTSGAYSAQSYIASAQRCINLYPEKNPADIKPPAPVTHYPRPGLPLLGQCPVPAPGRCLYGATNGDLYAVVGQNVFYISPDWQFTQIGQLQAVLPTPVSIADNGQSALIVDGTQSGYTIALGTRAFAQLGDPNFLGSNRVDFLDGFLILNDPNTNEWYSTQAQSITFNPLFIGIKTAWPDNVLCVVAIEREVYVFGPKKSEVWYNAGTVPFPFQLLPGVIIEQGCAALYSPAKMDTNVYWLSQSPEGDRMVMRGGNQNVAQRISTHAIEAEFRKYPRVDDAIGSVYQIEGHSFYKLHFPTADKTWGFDQATEQWHEDNAIDANGVLHRAHNTFNAFAYGKNVALDWSNGNLYAVDPNSYTDNGQPIPWIRSFPHELDELRQVSHTAFVADVETGTHPGTGDDGQFVTPWSQGFSSGFGPLTKISAPSIGLRCSRDGGNKFGNMRLKTKIANGRYRTMLRWRGNGIARDMVYELSSTAEMCSALNGAYFEPMVGSA